MTIEPEYPPTRYYSVQCTNSGPHWNNNGVQGLVFRKISPLVRILIQSERGWATAPNYVPDENRRENAVAVRSPHLERLSAITHRGDETGSDRGMVRLMTRTARTTTRVQLACLAVRPTQDDRHLTAVVQLSFARPHMKDSCYLLIVVGLSFPSRL